MKRIKWCVIVLALLALAGPGRAPAQDGKQGQEATGGMPGASAEEMQRMQALMSPGAQHKALARVAGEWKTSMKMWMGPGEPQVQTGTATGEMVHGGRYALTRHQATFMGMPFEGTSLDGYDNARKEYFTIWIDNFGTGVMHLRGRPAAEGDGIDFAGTMFDPMVGKEVPVRETVRWEGDDRYVFEMFGPMPQPDGTTSEGKIMELVAERLK